MPRILSQGINYTLRLPAGTAKQYGGCDLNWVGVRVGYTSLVVTCPVILTVTTMSVFLDTPSQKRGQMYTVIPCKWKNIKQKIGKKEDAKYYF